MDIIEKNTTNEIYCNISNEAVNTYYTMTIEAAEYEVNVTLSPPSGINNRYVIFQLTEGVENLLAASIKLPNYGDFPYKIINTTTTGGTDGVVVHRGILRLKQPEEVVYSYTDDETTIIYE